jgi:hypothetical protein
MGQTPTKIILDILFTELENMMNLANLGAGAEAGITEARRRIRQQLKQLTAEQQLYFDALVAEESLQPFEQPLQAELKSRLFSLLSKEDWAAVGEAAIDFTQKNWIELIESVGLPKQEKSGDAGEISINKKVDVDLAEIMAESGISGSR